MAPHSTAACLQDVSSCPLSLPLSPQAKLLFSPAAQHIQIIGMSATSERSVACPALHCCSFEKGRHDCRCGASSPPLTSSCPLLPPSTVGGLEALRQWLKAELFLTNFRPVPLTEHAVFGGKVYEKIGLQASLFSCSASLAR